jgi:selenocysteine lyase/cysteine desulfurase
MEATGAYDLAEVRKSFPILATDVYLNVGTYGIMPEPALAEYLEALAAEERSGVASRVGVDQRERRARETVAALIGAAPADVAFTRNTTDGINLAVWGLPWKEGDEAVSTLEEHEGMFHPLLWLQRTRGVRVKFVEVSPDPDRFLAALAAAVTPKTRLVAVSHVSCETGTRLPVREVCAWARARGITSLVDGAQALGAIPVDVRAIGCDCWAGSGHKWLCGPKGSGIFYATTQTMARLAPAHVGAGTFRVADRSTGEVEPQDSGARFEYGTRNHIISIGLLASLRWFEALGWHRIHEHVAGMAAYLKERLRSLDGVKLLTPIEREASSGLATFSSPGLDPQRLRKALGERHIHHRGIPHYDAIRISTAAFTSRDDVDALIAALESSHTR